MKQKATGIMKSRNDYEMNSCAKGFLVFPAPNPTHFTYLHVY